MQKPAQDKFGHMLPLMDPQLNEPVAKDEKLSTKFKI